MARSLWAIELAHVALSFPRLSMGWGRGEGGEWEGVVDRSIRHVPRDHLLCGSVAVDLALPLAIARLDGKLDGLAVDDALDIARHVEGSWCQIGYK